MTALLGCFRDEPAPGGHEIFISSVIGARRRLARNGPGNLVGRCNVPHFWGICTREMWDRGEHSQGITLSLVVAKNTRNRGDFILGCTYVFRLYGFHPFLQNARLSSGCVQRVEFV